MSVPAQLLFDETFRGPSTQPKYARLVGAVRTGMREGRLTRGDSLPSINKVSQRYGMARETVRKAYDILREQGLVSARHGKSFTVESGDFQESLNVFVLFEHISRAYKETLHDSLVEELDGRARLDVYAHHYNPAMFKALMEQARGRYECYVVIPFYHPVIKQTLTEFDQSKLILIDLDVDYPGKACAGVLQSHGSQLQAAMEEALPRLKRYERFILSYRWEEKFHPVVIKKAFRSFCRRHGIEHHIVSKLKPEHVTRGTAALVIEDPETVLFIKEAERKGLKLGRDAGLISYNDIPLKEVAAGGVTVVSVDFAEMGRLTAQAILSGSREQIHLPTRMIFRNSL